MVHLRVIGLEAAVRHLPTSFNALCALVEQVQGVRFRELATRLAEPNKDLDALMQDIVTQAITAASTQTQ